MTLLGVAARPSARRRRNGIERTNPPQGHDAGPRGALHSHPMASAVQPSVTPPPNGVEWRSLPGLPEAAAAPSAAGGFERWRRLGIFWPLHVAYWLFVWAAGQLVVEILRPDVANPGWFIASRVAVGFAATAGLRWLARRPDLLRRLGLSRPGAIVGGTIAVAVAATILQDRLWLALGPTSVASPSRWTIAMFIVRFAMLAGWAGIYLAATSMVDANRQYERALEAESAARLAEVRLLQAQMNPHFLFNALNSVLASKDDPEAVERVTQGLADYLRAALRGTRPLEPLGRELDALEGYLTVEEARFGDRLACSIDCDRAARAVLAPPVLVQPLVENALKYGVAVDGGPLRVAVRAAVDDGRLVLEVANTGRWEAAPDPARSHGLGLHGLRRRLEMLFDGEADVALAEGDGWVRVRVTIPAGAEGRA